jgi:putative glutamine amidotransferase
VTPPPLIGLCGALERARWSVWDMQAVLAPRNYLQRIEAAGGMPVVIGPDDALIDHVDALLDRLDGLILIGGSDIDPASYGAEAHPQTAGTVPERDRFELAITKAAWDREFPLLGICRGMQLMNIAAGGDLRQHLPDDYGHEDHRRVVGTFDGADHDVRLAPGSLAAQATGETHHATKSHHHQGVGRIGDGLTVTGWSELDDLPEAIEPADGRWALGVQWHPEADESSRLIAALVDEARSRLASRSVDFQPG